MMAVLRSRACFYTALLVIPAFIIFSIARLYSHEAVRVRITSGVANIFDAPGLFDSAPGGSNSNSNSSSGIISDLGSGSSSSHGGHARHDDDDDCAWVPDDFNILTVMKTGASEAFHKVPTQLLTAMRCIPHFYVFSDMKQKIGGVEVHDALDAMLPAAMDGNKDFDLYHRQKLCAADQDTCNKGYKVSKEGWNLDKYKNIHIAERSYHMAPDHDWYFTVDADTYVVWRNLIPWLARIDPQKQHYIGHRWFFADLPFAYGGAGYLLSQAAMADFVGRHPGIANQYDVETAEWEGGDFMLAKALKETVALPVVEAYPTLNPAKPSLMVFNKRVWCRPIATMHHVNSEEVSALYDFEQRFWAAQEAAGTARPLLAKDIYAEFLAPRLLERREDWDNLSDGKFYLDPNGTHSDFERDRAKKETDGLSEAEKAAHKSFEDCRKMCDEVEECLQYVYHEGKCAYHWEFALGKPHRLEGADKGKEAKRWTSGWKTERIRRWAREHDACEKMDWPEIE